MQSKVILPRAAGLAGGGPYFWLKNGGTIAVDLYELADPVTDPIVDLSVSLGVGDFFQAVVGDNGTALQWYFFA